MQTLTLANQKGGVAKSATATLLAHHAAHAGLRVLAVDLDHQGNFTKPLAKSGKPLVSATTADKLMTDPEAEVETAPFVLVPASPELLRLERQPDKHGHFAGAFRAFLQRVGSRFDLCIVDTNPSPDIRVLSALLSSNFVLSPIQMNQEAIDGIAALLGHERVGLNILKRPNLNPGLQVLGMLPSLLEPTPFQKTNFQQLAAAYGKLLIALPTGGFAAIPKRSIISEAQAAGVFLRDLRSKKTAARETWSEIEPTLSHILTLMGLQVQQAAA